MPFHMSGANATASFGEYNDARGSQTNFNGTAEETLRTFSNTATGTRLGTGSGRRQSSNASYHTNTSRERSGGGGDSAEESGTSEIIREIIGKAKGLDEYAVSSIGKKGRNSPLSVSYAEAGGSTTKKENYSAIEREESITKGISGTGAGNGLTTKDLSNTITEVENKPTIANEEAAEDSKLTHRRASDTGSGKGKGKATEAVPDDDKKTKKEEADMTAMLMTGPTFKLIIRLIWVWIRSFFPCLRK
ncbi:hypothetical protein PNOK_0754200 [Pyrrhoderma noxium]|uniref:Uncharacterized protein n=1 Tax=Pyrrhoderma noxium TaxID=2282107 RepID=A0A286UD57_9AGAM|nr:hypothetical protein PNOK_0754200 [Pyrrhoderma noxium]